MPMQWCVIGRRGHGPHRQGGLHHADKEAHHEVAEGEVAGPRQQGRETPAVQGDVRPRNQGTQIDRDGTASGRETDAP